MKFRIEVQYISYGGPVTGKFQTLHENVSADFVKGFFQNVRLNKQRPGLQTEEDKMGCCEIYRVLVTEI
jgi:hypothetical protein